MWVCFSRADPLVWTIEDGDRTDGSRYCVRVDAVTQSTRIGYYLYRFWEMIRQGGPPPP